MSTVKRGVDFLRAMVKYLANEGGFGAACMKNVEIVDGGDGKLKAEFKVLPEHLNSAGGLHGGFTASIVDILTSVALLSSGSHPGVSVDLHVSYLKAAKEGEVVTVDATTVKAGRIMAYIECELKNKATGVVIAKGNQTKYVALGKDMDYSSNVSS
ncbi:Acyl-coenzyme A thioesterase 13 [Sergentomyia squamirostris]